jgi:hypothetical protein
VFSSVSHSTPFHFEIPTLQPVLLQVSILKEKKKNAGSVNATGMD